MNDDTLRERILEVTVALMREHESASQVTVRAIAARAKVGLGLVNYHFGSRDELLAEAVQRYIAEEISGWRARFDPPGRSPRERLKAMLKGTARFLAEHPNVSRISIQRDLESPADDDNTSQTIAAMLPVLREATRDRLGEAELQLAALQITASLQSAFLRQGLLRKAGFDFQDPAQRDRLVEELVDRVLSLRRPR